MLVAIAIPVFTAALHSSQEATDKANCRSLYADLQAACLTNNANELTSETAGDLSPLSGSATTIVLSDGESITLNNSSTAAVEFVTDNANAKTGHYKVTYTCGSNDGVTETWGGAA